MVRKGPSFLLFWCLVFPSSALQRDGNDHGFREFGDSCRALSMGRPRDHAMSIGSRSCSLNSGICQIRASMAVSTGLGL